MEHKKAVDVLKNLMNKPMLTTEEKEAIFTAIGLLAWASLSKRKKKDTGKDTQW